MNVEMVDEEQFLVRTVRDFIDREVKPAVNEMEHRNEYPEKFIEQMKQIGIYGLAVPEEYGGTPVSMPCYVAVTEELARGWMSLAGAMGVHTVVAKLLTAFGTWRSPCRHCASTAATATRPSTTSSATSGTPR